MTEDDHRRDSNEMRERSVARAEAVVCRLIRKRLAEEGVDPALVRALQAINLPEAEDRGRDESEQSEDPNEEIWTWEADGLAEAFVSKIAAIVDKYQDGQRPNFSNASLAELFAWGLLPNAPNE